MPVTRAPLQVFLSYRRGDSRHVAARIGDRIGAQYGLFMDVDDIRPGMDFTEVVSDAVAKCDVLVAVIGPGWLTIRNSSGGRRLDDPNDWVVAEIAAALERSIPVIPVLVDGARMPLPEELPATVRLLARRQALAIRFESFAADTALLLSALERSADGPPKDEVSVDPDFVAALSAEQRQDWSTASELLERVVSRFPRHAEALGHLGRAREHLAEAQAEQLNGEALAHLDRQEWSEAEGPLVRPVSTAPEYRDSEQLLLSARQQAVAARARAVRSTPAGTDALSGAGGVTTPGLGPGLLRAIRHRPVVFAGLTSSAAMLIGSLTPYTTYSDLTLWDDGGPVVLVAPFAVGLASILGSRPRVGDWVTGFAMGAYAWMLGFTGVVLFSDPYHDRVGGWVILQAWRSLTLPSLYLLFVALVGAVYTFTTILKLRCARPLNSPRLAKANVGVRLALAAMIALFSVPTAIRIGFVWSRALLGAVPAVVQFSVLAGSAVLIVLNRLPALGLAASAGITLMNSMWLWQAWLDLRAGR